MSLNLTTYLKKLRKNSKELERKDINGKETAGFFSRNMRSIISLTISFSFVFGYGQGFSELFISYVSAILSILIGLFLTVLIFAFDKFYTKVDLNTASSWKVLKSKQGFNFVKQFSYLTGYNIVLSIFTLIILSCSTLFKELMDINIYNYSIDISGVGIDEVLNLLLVAGVIIQRFLIIYWITSITYNTLYVVSSMVEFMVIKISDLHEAENVSKD